MAEKGKGKYAGSQYLMELCAERGETITVQLPSGHPDHGHSADTYDVHGGITYGPDADGWMGFDAGHGGDFWPEAEILSWAAMGFHERRIQMALEDAREEAARKVPWAREWSLAQVRAETERLAEQVIDRAGC